MLTLPCTICEALHNTKSRINVHTVGFGIVVYAREVTEPQMRLKRGDMRETCFALNVLHFASLLPPEA